ncbi:hypothetical protein AB1Y20_013973 [Prymnesium parvum]|uniref:Uncharacterized protein n=1 Tax=Prymnesium parvum TaxID=97485 RepID=A0AB34IF54_PRYPA
MELLSLPAELLAAVLSQAAPWRVVCPESKRIPLPPLALVCTAFLHAVRSAPLAIRYRGIRRVPSEWAALFSALEAADRPVEALSLHASNIRIDLLQPLLHSSSSLTHLAVLKCHSLQLPLLALAPAAALTSLCLGGAERVTHGLACHRQLRLLSLVESAFCLDELLAVLPLLRQLLVLMLGGARVRAAAAHEEALAPAELAPSSLRLVEVTFLDEASVRAALRRHFPRAAQLDLSGGAEAMHAGLTLVHTLLTSALGASGERAADEAVRSAVQCRSPASCQTPLHHAAVLGDVRAVECLLLHHASPDLKDAKGCTALHRALFWGHHEVVLLLLRTGQCDISSTNHAMEQPIYIAALRGHLTCLRYLLAEEVPRAARAYHDGYTPLHAAVIGKAVPCLRLLLQHGFDVDARNRFGQTALHLAARLGSEQSARSLLAARASGGLLDERGHTPLAVARNKGHAAVAALLADAAAAAPQPQRPDGARRRRRRGGGAAGEHVAS